MSEFFLELFSEEIPAGLQQNARKILLENFQKLFEEKKILFKKSKTFSTPNRLIVLFEGLSKEITQKAEEIKGPNVNAPDKAIEGFLRSNQINKKNLFKKKIIFLLISRLLYSKGVLNYLDSAILISKKFKKKCLFYVAGKIDKNFQDSIPLFKLRKYQKNPNIKIYFNVKNVKNLIYKSNCVV